jgi:diguanylate cyclase (GGDEF)-like protein
MTERGGLGSRLVHVSLRTKILAVVLLCVSIPVLLMAIYLIQRNQGVLEEKVRETLSNRLYRTATQVDDWMSERVHDASRWSTSFVVFESVETLSQPRGDAERARRDLKDFLESVLGHYKSYESLFIVDLAGNILASTREERLEEWGMRLLNNGGPNRGGTVSPIHQSEHLGRPTILVMHTIQGRNDRTVGYFAERLDLSELEALVGPPSTDSAPLFWMLDDEGRVLVKGGKVAQPPGAETFPAPMPDAAAAPETDDRPLAIESRLKGLGRTVVALKRLGRSGGVLAATVPANVAYRSLEESRNRLLMVGVPALAAVFLISFVLARGMLRPIQSLSQAAKRLSAGELDVRLPVKGGDELTELTQSFNQMAAIIQEKTKQLEEARNELALKNADLEAANRHLHDQAITDALTGLYNRRHFQDNLDKEMRRCEREERPLSLLLLDLDHFKQYNDRWGHTQGDEELRRVGAQVTKSIRSTDMAFRYGGEEFAVLLPSCTKEQAAEVGEKIRVAVGVHGHRAGVLGRTTVSIGVATFPQDGRAARALVDTADGALYAAKAAGRDRVSLAGAPAPPADDAQVV